MNKNIIIFDFDGVVIDSFEICFKTAKQLVPQIGREDFYNLFYGNVYRQIEKLSSNIQNINKLQSEEFFKLYTKRILEKAPMRGIKTLLRDLSRSASLYLISSTYNQPIQTYVEKFGIASNFTEILGGDVAKSKVKKFRMVGKKEGIVLEDALFVTDTLGDMLEAQKVNLPTTAVTWGFHKEETLKKGVPEYIVNQVRGLRTVCETHFEQ